ncbi:hypothetical protein EJP02_291 [Escherichia phage EJP2]|nr:hypothetical protein EJP02_291 [Escherichia phage EJP2]
MSKKTKKLKENASAGATSAGAIASVPTGLHYSILMRIPKSDFFGYSEVDETGKKKTKKGK